MDQAPKQGRRGIAIVVAVLVVVCAWWLLFVPRTGFYENYKQESDLKRTLRGISPPAGSTLLGIRAMSVPTPERVLLMSYYQAPSFDVVESHYMQEFPRHGFIYQPSATTVGSDHILKFCAPGYLAVLSLVKNDRPLTYGILLHRRDGPC